MPKRICGAKTRAGGECQQSAMTNGRCRMHGGKSLTGPAHPNWKDGSRSKILPGRLLERYTAAVADPELLNLREDIATLEARLWDVLSRVDKGESGRFIGLIRAAYRQVEAAVRSGDAAALRLGLGELGDVINRSHADWAAWEDARAIMRDKRALIESERKRLVEMQQMVTTQEAMQLVAALAAAVTKHVSDPKERANVNAEVRGLLGRSEG